MQIISVFNSTQNGAQNGAQNSMNRSKLNTKLGVNCVLLYALCIIMCLMTLTLSGCGSSPQKKATSSSSIPSSKPLEQALDLNRDGKEDAWRYFKDVDGERIIQRKEFDLNFDGEVDFKRLYSPTGQLISEEMDPLFVGGQFSLKTYYEDQKLVRKERSLIGDERPEVFKYYKGGVMYYLEHDRNGDGVLDGWEYYREGQLVRLGFDQDQDGQPDFWKELD
jgi:hypothetical protein